MMVECPPPAEVYPLLLCTGIDTRNATAVSGPKKWSVMNCPCRPSLGGEGKDKLYPCGRLMQDDSVKGKQKSGWPVNSREMEYVQKPAARSGFSHRSLHRLLPIYRQRNDDSDDQNTLHPCEVKGRTHDPACCGPRRAVRWVRRMRSFQEQVALQIVVLARIFRYNCRRRGPDGKWRHQP